MIFLFFFLVAILNFKDSRLNNSNRLCHWFELCSWHKADGSWIEAGDFAIKESNTNCGLSECLCWPIVSMTLVPLSDLYSHKGKLISLDWPIRVPFGNITQFSFSWLHNFFASGKRRIFYMRLTIVIYNSTSAAGFIWKLFTVSAC